MTAETLPIVCGYCRRPLRYLRGRGLLDAQAGKPHFYRGDTCLFVSAELAQDIDRLRAIRGPADQGQSDEWWEKLRT